MATLSSELAGFRDFMGGEDGDESAMNRKRTGGEIGDDLTAMATATATAAAAAPAAVPALVSPLSRRAFFPLPRRAGPKSLR